VQLVSKIFNLCGRDPPTSQTDRQTTCDSNTALCTIVHGAATRNAWQSLSCSLRGLTVSPPITNGSKTCKPEDGSPQCLTVLPPSGGATPGPGRSYALPLKK